MAKERGSKITGGWLPFAAVSKTVAFDDSLSASERSVYMALCSYMNSESRSGYPSRKTLRGNAKVSEATLTRAIKKLEQLGYIEVIPNYKKDANGKYTGERGPNDYHIVNI